MSVGASVRAALSVVLLATLVPAQSWQESCGETRAGIVALRQAVKDTGSDCLALVVASHPDDRYVLPAVWLRYVMGLRIAVLLATRGGGGQNISGPESGDALERIRTLETEAGCSHFDGEVWYLNRPDAGYRRTAEATFGEWGREQSLRDLVRLIRTIRPDVILTTHNFQEQHGHDVALVELLTNAVPLAGDAEFLPELPVHRPRVFGIGATADSPSAISIPVDRLEPLRGASFRHLAREILRMAHLSPGPPVPLEELFEPTLRFELRLPPQPGDTPFAGLPSLFDPAIWPGDPERAAALDRFVRE
ncbi:MAG: PIG-L family deacetylase [Planctomycetes bacterium]|nr:PIG-L family deacetylase [Planctomycetota bacterium]